MKPLVFILLLLFSAPHEYPLKHGKPTPKGVEMYVEDNRDSLIAEYQDFINDTLWLDVWLYAEDLTDYVEHDSLELGRYWYGEAVISMDTLFKAYEIADFSKIRRRMEPETNAFVKSTIFHELTHHYIVQVGKELEFIDSIKVHKSYETGIWIIHNYAMFGSTFIEEGICEYLVEKMGEVIPPKRRYIPKTHSDLIATKNRYKVVYKYSASYLQTFLDTAGFKKGIKILISNDPPNYNEILNPDLFFERLCLDI